MFRSLRSKKLKLVKCWYFIKRCKNEDVIKGHLLCKKIQYIVIQNLKQNIYIIKKKKEGRRHPLKKNINPQFIYELQDLTGSLNLTMI